MDAMGAVRSAEAALRANGGRQVMLQVPAPAVPGQVAEELGLATPEFQGVALGPAVFRKAGSTAVLLIAASAVTAAVGVLAFDSVDVLFQTAAGIQIDGVLYGIEDVTAEGPADAPYCYAVSLQAPTW